MQKYLKHYITKILQLLLLLSLFHTKIYCSHNLTNIISLAPNITENLYYIELPPQYLKGFTIYCTNLSHYFSNAITLGNILNPSIEKIYSLHPQLILMTKQGNTKETYQYLKKLNLNTIVFDETNINAIISELETLTNILNIYKPSVVEKINTLKKITSTKPKKMYKGLIILSYPVIYTASTNTFINDILELSGIQNIITTKLPYPVVSIEEIYMKKPEIILVAENNRKEFEYIRDSLIKALGSEVRIIQVDADKISRPSYNAILYILELREIIGGGKL